MTSTIRTCLGVLALLASPAIPRAACTSTAFVALGPAGNSLRNPGSTLRAADFNGDGALDLVLGGQKGAYLLLHGGPEPGNFRSPASISSGPVTRLAVGDVNHDGKLDVVITNSLGNSVTTLLGHGDGTFTANTFHVSTSPRYLALADINGDGLPDLITSGDYPSTTLSIFLGHGDGTFDDPLELAAPSFIESLAVVDLNGDGRIDVITGTGFQSTPEIQVWLGRGDGTFRSAVSFAAPALPVSIATADLDGDGRPDVITSDFLTQSVSVFHNKGGGILDAPVSYALPKTASSSGNPVPLTTIAGDFLGSGRNDLAVACQDGFVAIFPANGDGTFRAATSFWMGNQIAPIELIAVDLDGDGHLDLASSNNGSGGGAALMQNVCSGPTAPKRRAAPHQ